MSFEQSTGNVLPECIKMLMLGPLTIQPITSDTLADASVLALRRHIRQAHALQVSSARSLGSICSSARMWGRSRLQGPRG